MLKVFKKEIFKLLQPCSKSEDRLVNVTKKWSLIVKCPKNLIHCLLRFLTDLVIKSCFAFFTSLCDFLIPFFGRWEMGKEKLAQSVMNSVFVIFPKLTSFHIRRMNIESTWERVILSEFDLILKCIDDRCRFSKKV